MLGELQPWHIIIVLLAFVLLFGSKKLPDTARSLGRSLRMFKSEMNQMREENTSERAKSEPAGGSAAPPSAGTPQVSADRPATSAAEPAREPVTEHHRA